MKKFLIIMFIMSLFSGLAFAAADKASTRAAKDGTKLEITTITEELSTALYPSMLVPGSSMGTSVFMSDFLKMPNVASFEYVFGNTFGVFALDTEIGKIGFSITPMPYAQLRDITVNSTVNNNVVGLSYGNTIAGLPVGISLFYGANKTDYNILDVTADDPDIHSEASQYIGTRVGASVGGIDLAAGLALNNYVETSEDWNNAYNWDYWEQYEDSKIIFDVSARMTLAYDIKAYAMLTWVNGAEKYTYTESSTDIEEYYNSKLSLIAGAGKDFKIGDTIILKTALGIDASGDTDSRYRDWTDYDVEYVYYGNFDANSDSTIDFPLNVAVEGKINETWSFKSGVKLVLLRIEDDKVAQNTADYKIKIREFEVSNMLEVSPEFDYAFGLTGVIGDLKLDMFINPTIFLTGPYMFGGAGAGSLSAGLAFSYIW